MANIVVDYLIWDDADGLAGLSGFLNQETRNDGVPVFIDQGGSKSIAGGIDQARSKIRLADMNGYVCVFRKSQGLTHLQ